MTRAAIRERAKHRQVIMNMIEEGATLQSIIDSLPNGDKLKMQAKKMLRELNPKKKSARRIGNWYDNKL